ncbi:MAG: helix-turn-helix domain-containing protein [Clostridia bacterium]|nr:helix-turn-helix domain-containing protein [Clostridia bacterium]
MRNLKALRAKHDFTQAELAKILKISEVSYRNKENRKTQFKLQEARKISKLFAKSIEVIFFND